MIKKIFDVVLSSFALVVFILPMIIIALIVRITTKGPALHWSKRVGRKNQIFLMPKFRSMSLDTPQVATHLLSESKNYITPFGRFLRATSLDELPQLWSVFKGDMSLVGPRPALFNQDDLIEMRTNADVHTLLPGVTGWAQVNGRDDLAIPIKVALDIEYLKKRNLLFDIKIISLTILKVLKSEGIKH